MVTIDDSNGNGDIKLSSNKFENAHDVDLAISSEFGSEIYIDKNQAAKLIEILQKFIDGEEV